MGIEKTVIALMGDTWDWIAKREYGTETMQHHLLAANPDLGHILFFAGGEAVTVPAVDMPVDTTPPPWKEF